MEHRVSPADAPQALRSRQGHPLRPATGTHFLGGKTGWGDLDLDGSVPMGPQLWRAKLTAPGARSRLDQVPVAVRRPHDSLDQGLAREQCARNSTPALAGRPRRIGNLNYRLLCQSASGSARKFRAAADRN
jgi:hypothetical protein